MSHRNVSASTTTTLLATSIAPESPQIKAFVRSAMERLGLTEQEVRKRAIEAYGSVERTMKAMEIGEAENKAAIERACPNGYAEIQVGRKPKPGEEVTFSQLRDDLMVRVWGGDLASYESYCFDFVNRKCQYILTPDDPERPGSVHGGFIGKGEGGRRYTPTQPGVIPTGRLTSFVKAPFSVLRSRTTRIVFSIYPCEPLMLPLWFSIYPCEPLMLPLWFSNPGERDVGRNHLVKPMFDSSILRWNISMQSFIPHSLRQPPEHSFRIQLYTVVNGAFMSRGVCPAKPAAVAAEVGESFYLPIRGAFGFPPYTQTPLMEKPFAAYFREIKGGT
ncbi:hypothetical protein JOM56_004714 [Amanita muscaria]